VYLTAKRAGAELAETEAAAAAAAYEEQQQAMDGQLQPAYSTSGG
jgi:hypothetical protein